MSIQQINTEVFDNVYQKLWVAKFNKECNINHVSGVHDLSEDQIKELVLQWCDLNERSYCERYKDHEEVKYTDYRPFINFRASFSSGSPHQFLMWLEAIHYNIEAEYCKPNKQELEAIKKLKGFIDDVKNAIIDSLPEYKMSKWNEV